MQVVSFLLQEGELSLQQLLSLIELPLRTERGRLEGTGKKGMEISTAVM